MPPNEVHSTDSRPQGTKKERKVNSPRKAPCGVVVGGHSPQALRTAVERVCCPDDFALVSALLDVNLHFAPLRDQGP
ncbi:MAG: hypothetical protein ACE5OZ_17100 [Candidatus Heimdallarchaeota archaeon]